MREEHGQTKKSQKNTSEHQHTSWQKKGLLSLTINVESKLMYSNTKETEKHVLLSNTLAFETVTAQSVRLGDKIIAKWP